MQGDDNLTTSYLNRQYRQLKEFWEWLAECGYTLENVLDNMELPNVGPKRECWPTSNPDCLDYLTTGQEWPRLRSVVKLVGRCGAETGVTVQPPLLHQ